MSFISNALPKYIYESRFYRNVFNYLLNDLLSLFLQLTLASFQSSLLYKEDFYSALAKNWGGWEEIKFYKIV